MSDYNQKLFADFPPVPTGEWEAVIAADLKGADYDKKLVWHTAEGFNVRPYYRAEDLKGLPHLDTKAGEFPYLRGTEPTGDWRAHQTIGAGDAKKANAEALKILSAGCDSIGFCISREDFSAADLDALLSGVVIGAIEIVFQGAGARKVAELMLAKLDKETLAPKDAKISFVLGPDKDLVDKFAKYPLVRTATVKGQTFGDSGSTIVQELAFAMAQGKEFLDKGVSADRIRFSMSVSSNYFMEIAKFRAARVLWAEIANAKIFAHAVTSRWNQTVYDPYVNMLRGTTEAMSAAIAGVHSLEVRPFDDAFETPTEFSRRIARNVQLLLKHESHFDSVVDASGGAYYIENLTNSIAIEAKKLYDKVQSLGGYCQAEKSGFVTETIEASAAAKAKAIATRRTILLGANQYPNFTEKAPDNITEQTIVQIPQRGAMPFEQIRLRTDRSGKTPKAFMLTCGTLAMARARAQFACNFFACAGIEVVDNTFFANVEDGAKAALKAKADIVVVCASDDDYATLAPEAHKLLGDKAILVVAGAPASQSELEAQGITHFISVRSNVLETLKNYLKELGI